MEDLNTSFKVIPKVEKQALFKKKLPPDNPEGTRRAGSGLFMMTVGLFETYKKCDSEMKSFMFCRPKRFITTPSEGKQSFYTT